MPPDRLTQLFERIDQLNREDPNAEQVGGTSVPRELAYAQRLTDWVDRLRPDPSEALRIAARGQHVQRWTIPRDRYAQTRQGYLRWREVLKTFHIETVVRLMHGVGFPDATIQRVREIMGKRRLQDDPESQTLEDALCLIFFETQLTELKQKTPDDKLQEVVRKVLKRMSAQGRTELSKLTLDADTRACIAAATKAR